MAGDPIDLRRNCTTVTWDPWGPPIHLNTTVYEDRIEIDYKAEATTYYSFSQSPPKVWREIYTAVDGKLVKEVKEGQYHSPQGEHYTFE